jgi:hypothetical protein
MKDPMATLIVRLKAHRRAHLTARLVKMARTISPDASARLKTLARLVDRGADVHGWVPCEPGTVPQYPRLSQLPLLSLACALRDAGLVRLLLENGVNPNRRLEPGGDTALQLCLRGTRMVWRRTPGPVFDWDIHISALAFDLIRLLLEYGANPGLANDVGVNAFETPVECHYQDEDKAWWDSLREQYRLECNIGPARAGSFENPKRL